MRTIRYTCALAALLLWSGCSKDLSCYRDMIIGTWVEQTFDGQVVETKLRSVHLFDRMGQHTVTRRADDGDNNWVIADINTAYSVSCKIIATSGLFEEGEQMYSFFREEEVLRFTDTTLKVKVLEEVVGGSVVELIQREVLYTKVSKANLHATAIQNLWEMTQSSDSGVAPFRIRFNEDGTYILFLNTEEGWTEKTDEEGMYRVFDSFLITSFFNNPLFGVRDRGDVACWEITIEEEDAQKSMGEGGSVVMRWQAMVNVDGQLKEKRFLFVIQP